jgi:hypothetical protein
VLNFTNVCQFPPGGSTSAYYAKCRVSLSLLLFAEWLTLFIVSSQQNIHFFPSGNTALHNAVIHAHSATATCLLNHGGDLAVVNKAGQSALYMALLHKRRSVARLLHAAGGRLAAREVDMYQTYEARRYEEKQDFLDWALHEFNTPASLADNCRVVIRRCLAKSKCLWHTSQALSLPVALRNFVLFSDFYSDSGPVSGSGNCCGFF